MVKFKSPAGRRGCREDAEHDGDENGVHDQQDYVQALGTDNAEGECWAAVMTFFTGRFVFFADRPWSADDAADSGLLLFVDLPKYVWKNADRCWLIF